MLVERIVKILREYEVVIFAYLFGSHARGEAGKLSDIDVAVYLDPSLTQDAMWDTFLDIASRLSFRDVEVDVVLLNTTSYRLAFEVLKGRLLFSRDEEMRKEFIYRTLRTYLDRRYYDLRRAEMTLSR
mgnify:CR=1 FL=1